MKEFKMLAKMLDDSVDKICESCKDLDDEMYSDRFYR